MRKRKRGNKTFYYFEVNKDGERKLIALGDDYHEALINYSNKIINAKSDDRLFISVVDRYFKEVAPKKAERTQKDNKKEVQFLLTFFKEAPIDAIKPKHVRQYLDWRSDAPIRANREIALFSHIFNMARAWGYTDNQNPCEGVKKHKETGRTQYITDDLYKKVYDCACQLLKNAMDLAYLTGQRPADVLKMKWSDVYEDVGRQYLFILQNKTGSRLSIPIDGDLAALLDKMDKGTKTILNLSDGALRSRFDKAREAAQIPKNDFQFKDLRAKAAEDTTTSSSLKDAQALLGHKNETMTRHYANRSEKGHKVEVKIKLKKD